MIECARKDRRQKGDSLGGSSLCPRFFPARIVVQLDRVARLQRNGTLATMPSKPGIAARITFQGSCTTVTQESAADLRADGLALTGHPALVELPHRRTRAILALFAR